MIDHDLGGYTVYQVHYRLKNAKRIRCAYSGDDKEVYEQTIADLEQREDLRYLSKSATVTEVTLFD